MADNKNSREYFTHCTSKSQWHGLIHKLIKEVYYIQYKWGWA